MAEVPDCTSKLRIDALKHLIQNSIRKNNSEIILYGTPYV